MPSHNGCCAVMHLVPAHMRHLELVALRIVHVAGKAHHLAVQYPQPGNIALGAVFEQHLQADTDTEKRLVACGQPARHRANRAHPVRACSPASRPVRGTPRARPARSRRASSVTTISAVGSHLAQGLFDRAQVAHTVIDYRDIDHVEFTVFPWWKASRRPCADPVPAPCAARGRMP